MMFKLNELWLKETPAGKDGGLWEKLFRTKEEEEEKKKQPLPDSYE